MHSRLAALGIAGFLLHGCAPADQPEARRPASASQASRPAGAPLAPIRVSGSYWIELSPVLVAANRFYPEPMSVGEGGITRITSGEADLATNAETQLLRESLTNPDLRIIMTVTESFYRLVARRSAGIETLADLNRKRVMLPRNTSANYFLVAMLRTVGLTEDDVAIVGLPPAQGDQTGMDQMSDALARGDVDAISIWEPEPEDAIRSLGSDAVVFQDRGVYREVFNLHARAADLADSAKRRSIVAFVRAVSRATEALQSDPTLIGRTCRALRASPSRKYRGGGRRWSSPCRSSPTCSTCSRRKSSGLPRNATALRAPGQSLLGSSIGRWSTRRCLRIERCRRPRGYAPPALARETCARRGALAERLP